MSIHFITGDFELKSLYLQRLRFFTFFFLFYFYFFLEDHTGKALAQGLKDALINLKLENLLCITTDNRANIVKSTSINDSTRLQCFGHRLLLAIGEFNKIKMVFCVWGCCCCCCCVCLFIYFFNKLLKHNNITAVTVREQ